MLRAQHVERVGRGDAVGLLELAGELEGAGMILLAAEVAGDAAILVPPGSTSALAGDIDVGDGEALGTRDDGKPGIGWEPVGAGQVILGC